MNYDEVQAKQRKQIWYFARWSGLASISLLARRAIAPAQGALK